MRDQTKVALANQDAQPEFAFSKALDRRADRDNLRARPLTPAMVDQMDLEKSMAFYKDRFADASGFTFVFVGSFELATHRDRSSSGTSASLPVHRPRTRPGRTSASGGPPDVVERRVVKGIEPKSQARIVFTGPFQYDPVHRAVIRAMAMVARGPAAADAARGPRRHLQRRRLPIPAIGSHDPSTRCRSDSGAIRPGPTRWWTGSSRKSPD